MRKCTIIEPIVPPPPCVECPTPHAIWKIHTFSYTDPICGCMIVVGVRYVINCGNCEIFLDSYEIPDS